MGRPKVKVLKLTIDHVQRSTEVFFIRQKESVTNVVVNKGQLILERLFDVFFQKNNEKIVKFLPKNLKNDQIIRKSTACNY